MTEEAKEMWTIEELVQMTEEVQSTELEWQGKALKIQWCELNKIDIVILRYSDTDEQWREQIENGE